MNWIWSTVVVVLVVLLGGVRWLFPERPMTYVGPRALLDAGFSLGLLGLILLIAGGLGRKVQRWLKLDGLTRLERTVFGLSAGLGVLAYGVLALGLVGLLRPRAILLWLVLAGVWSWREWTEILEGLPDWLAQQFHALQRSRLDGKAWLMSAGLIAVLTLLQALTPPWDYDGLMYHLQGPRFFLEAGRIVLLPDIWQANGPLTIEMLFAVGLAFDSDTFAKLMHLACTVLLVLATFAFGRRYLRPTGEWTAAAILVGIPIFPVWASLAYADMAWALYEFLALYALTLGMEDDRCRWPALSGAMMGLALGSKYLALGGAAVLGLWLLWQSRAQGWKAVLVRGVLFGGTALLVGSPWYIKNWLIGGNPVYPLFLGGTGWTADRMHWHTVYHHSFGTGHSVWDYLLLPWNLYAQHTRFGTFMGSAEILSPLFPLALLYPRTHRSRAMDGLAVVTLVRFAVWSLGSQQTRFLLPIFPTLSLLTSGVFTDLTARFAFRRWGRILQTGLTGGIVVATLLYSLLLFAKVQPLEVVSGGESKDTFLRRTVNDYPALQFVRDGLPPQARVLMMWDGSAYYCDERCLPDAENSRWTRLTLTSPSVSSAAASLRAMGVTHLLFSVGDADFMLQHDPTGQHRRAAEFFLQEFRPLCTKEIYRDEWVQLYELTCP
jgi:hypothetical protein